MKCQKVFLENTKENVFWCFQFWHIPEEYTKISIWYIPFFFLILLPNNPINLMWICYWFQSIVIQFIFFIRNAFPWKQRKGEEMMLMAEQDFEYCLLTAQKSLWKVETGVVNMKKKNNPPTQLFISNQATVSLRQITEILPRPQEVAGNVPTP